MNANPADCACERCEIDRERAPYQRAWLTAFREATTAQVSAALDAVESGSHRDSPAAIRALLALTGLMLEKESELSGAVVGGAAGQQDQGEESPMAAAEMERRIGLMGRLNDAAARLRHRNRSRRLPTMMRTSGTPPVSSAPPASRWCDRYAASGPSCRNGTSWAKPAWWCWPAASWLQRTPRRWRSSAPGGHRRLPVPPR